MNLIVKKFGELTTKELYEILKARAEIFIMEQDINYQDMDDIDYKSVHFFFQEEDKIVAYLRAFYPADKKENVQIGRVLTIEHGKGFGKKLLEESLIKIKEIFPCNKIVMDAQKHAISFYEQFGFIVTSDDFSEEGVIHVKMELDMNKKISL